MLGVAGVAAAFLTTMTRASRVPLVTGPPANTRCPAASALSVSFLPLSRTTEVPVSAHVQLVPLAVEMMLGAEDVLPMAQQAVVLLHTSWVSAAIVTPL